MSRRRRLHSHALFVFALAPILFACSAGTDRDDVVTNDSTSTSPTLPATRWVGAVDARACGGNAAAVPLIRCSALAGAMAVSAAVCGDLEADNVLTIDPPSSSTSAVASLAVDGTTRTSAPLHVGGSFTSIGAIEADNVQQIDGDLKTAGAFTNAAPVSVHGDAFVGGAIDARNTLTIGGTLHATTAPEKNVSAASVDTTPFTIASPLDCRHSPDIAARVNAASVGSAYDVPLDALDAVSSETTISLGCSRYHFDSIGVDAPLTIHVEGNVVVFVDFDVRLGAETKIDLAPDATLDFAIGGKLEIDAPFTLTASGSPAWLGVGGDVHVGAPTSIDASFLAPNGRVEVANTLVVGGALFVKSLHVGAPMKVVPRAFLATNGCVLPASSDTRF